MGNQESVKVTPWEKCYKDIKDTHNEAFRVIEEAITLEEQERPHDAIEKYKQGILLVDKALNIQVTFPENPTEDFQQACTMIQKMKRSRGEILQRIHSIQSAPDFVPLPSPPPPSYEEVVSGSASNIPQTYVDLAAALNNLHADQLKDKADIIYSQNNVKLYYISPNGDVTATEENQTLKIGLVEGVEETTVRAFLQIGDWTYPLVPGVSPCYRSNYGAFIFPDLHSDIPDASVAFMLSQDADSEVYDLLESILHGIVGEVSVKEEHKVIKRDGEDKSTAVSRGIATGAYYISQGLIFSAQKAGDLMNYTTPKLISKITPRQNSTTLPPALTKSLKIAENATSTAANVTGFVADKVGEATSKLGHFLAPHIKKQGTRLLTTSFNLNEQEASSKVDGVLTVAAGAIEGFTTVYRGLETSAGILGKNLKDNSVKIVEHKYGNTAGEATSDTLNTVGNVFTIAHNSKVLTPKGLAKKTAKETGKAVVREYYGTISNPNNLPQSEFEPSTSYNPNCENALEKK